MTIINDTSVVIYTSDELKTILEQNNNYTHIYFGANITLTPGIKIASTKTNVIIDGTYQNTTYILEDMKSLSASNTINVSSNNTTKVTVQNMNIKGYNYYGVIYVPESTAYANTIIEYNNVIYTTKTIEIVYLGDLTLDSAPTTISFDLNPISLNPIIWLKTEKIEIQITDTRVNNTPWNLYAQIDNDLTSENDYTLPFALIFIDNNKTKYYLSTEKTLIYSNTTSETPKITTVTMEQTEGLLLELRIYLVNNNTYKTNLIWSIEEENT